VETSPPPSEPPVANRDGIPVLTVAARSLGLLAGEAASVGLALWSIRAWDRLEAYVGANQISAAGRKFVLLNMAGAVAIAFVAAAVVLARGRQQGLDLVHRASRRLAPLLLAALTPLLLNWKLWVGRELTFLLAASVFGMALVPLVRMSATAPPLLTWRPAHPRFTRVSTALSSAWRSVSATPALPFVLVLVAGLSYAVYFSIVTIDNHYKLVTAAFDLALEDNLVWNAVHGGPLFKSSPLGGPGARHGGYHQTYFAYVIGLVYLIVPGPKTLLAIQATLMGAAAVPLYFLASRRLGCWTACLVACLFLLYPPLHGANLYDFHYLPFAPLFLWTTACLIDRQSYRWAAVAVLLTLSVREDVAALLAVLGCCFVLTGERPRAGAVVAVVSSVYFVALKLVIMPRLLGGHSSFVHQYQGLVPEGHAGFGGVLGTVFGNPGFTLGTLLERDKLVYFLQIAAPLAFLPWRRPIGLLCSVPGLFFTLLSTGYWPLVQISFQYTAYWTSFLFLAIVANLASLREHRHAWLVALTAAMVITSHQMGAVLQHNNVRGGFGQIRIGVEAEDHRRHEDLYSLIALVPPMAKIVASETVAPHVSSRPDAYTLRTGLFDAEYLLWVTPARGDEAPPVQAALLADFGVVAERGEFVLARRGHDKAANAGVLARMGM